MKTVEKTTINGASKSDIDSLMAVAEKAMSLGFIYDVPTIKAEYGAVYRQLGLDAPAIKIICEDCDHNFWIGFYMGMNWGIDHISIFQKGDE